MVHTCLKENSHRLQSMKSWANVTIPQALNPHAWGPTQSATLAINERCHVLQREGGRICRLGLGQSPFPVPTEAVHTPKLYAREKDYLPVKGLPALRGAVAEFHGQKDHIEAHPEGVLVGPGSKELLLLLQLAFDRELIVPTPCWVSYVPQAKIPGRKLHLIHTRFDPQATRPGDLRRVPRPCFPPLESRTHRKLYPPLCWRSLATRAVQPV